MGARPGGHTVWRRIRGGESTVETGSPGSPGSTSRLCEATLDPGPLPTADHRVVYRGPGFLLRLLAVRVQAPSNTSASTAALSRCLPKKKQTCRCTCHGTKRRPTTDQENDDDFDELTELGAKEERRRAQPRASRARYRCDRTFA